MEGFSCGSLGRHTPGEPHGFGLRGWPQAAGANDPAVPSRRLPMALHFAPPLFGVPYCADNHPSRRQVHDLERETSACRIYEIIVSDHAVPFHSLAEAHAAGYADCPCCVGVAATGWVGKSSHSHVVEPEGRRLAI
jgi:hypothetical protein